MIRKTPRPCEIGIPPAQVLEESDQYDGQQPRAISKDTTVSRDAWLNTKLLKLLGIVYGIASPFLIWIVVSINTHNTDLALQKMKLDHTVEKLAIIERLNNKIDEINGSINKIQIDIATLKTKASIP